MLKLQAGIHSLRNLFWLVKDTFLSEIVRNNNINPTWRVFEQVHLHNRIYHRGNIKSYFYPQKTLICCNKRNHDFIFYTLTKTVKIRRRRLTDSVVMTRKEGYDQLVMSRNSSRIKASRKTQGRLLLSFKNPDFFSGLSELYRIFSKMTEFMGVVYMLHRSPHLHCRKQWHMHSSERSHR